MNRIRNWIVVCIVLSCSITAVGQVGHDGEYLRELVQMSDLVVQGIAGELKAETGGAILAFQLPRRRRGVAEALVLGPKSLRGWPVFVPEGSPVSFTPNEACALFLRADPENRRLVLVQHPQAKFSLEAEVVERVREAWKRHRHVIVSMSGEKPRYTCGDKVVLVWQLKNNSSSPRSVYVGPYVFQLDYIVAGRMHGTSIGGSRGRKVDDYIELAPGESHEERLTIPDIVPEGNLGIRIRYICTDNWVGSSERKVESRVEGVFLEEVEHRFSLPIDAPGDEAVALLLAKLQSEIWQEQREAMEVLARCKSTSRLEEVRAMARHPWSEIRELCVEAVTLFGQETTEELKALLYDPSYEVRSAALQKCSHQRKRSAALPILAQMLVLREAEGKGYLEAAQRTPRQVSTLYRLNDERLGDVLLAQFGSLPEAPYLLSGLTGKSYGRLRSSEPLAEAVQEQVRADWLAKRETVKDRWSTEDLQREMASFRTKAFADFGLAHEPKDLWSCLKALGDRGPKEEEALAKVEEMGKDFVPTAVFILNNSSNYKSVNLCKLFGQWRAREAVPWLLAECHRHSSYAISSAIAVMQIDPEAARPQIEQLFPDNYGAVLALGVLGERRAVPHIMKHLGRRGRETLGQENVALTACTGKEFVRVKEWQDWWEAGGRKLVWE